MTSWTGHTLWWQVYPLGFLGAEPSAPDDGRVRHRLAELEPWLDYLIRIGLNGLALGPVFASSTHGYDTTDHLRVDPRLGDEEDLIRLLQAAHDRGIRVLFDGVFNHLGEQHPAFLRALEQGPGSPDDELFRIDWAGAAAGQRPPYQCFEGHGQLVTLNHDSPRVADLVSEAMGYWLERGIDGWRLDAAYAVPPAFWAKVLPPLRERFPGAYILGEVIHGDYAAIVTESGMDTVTQYELWKAIWSSLNDANLFELAWALKRHAEFQQTFVPYTFVGNHDVTRIATQLHDRALLPHALVLLFTLGGSPAVYYGDEFAITGHKEERYGGDDAIRPAFGTPSEVEAGLDEQGRETLRLHQELIGVRRRHPWLHTAVAEPGELANTVFSYRVADPAGTGAALVVALNTGADPVRVATPGAAEALAGYGVGAVGSTTELAAKGWAVLRG